MPYLELRYNKTFCDKTGKKSVFRITAFRVHTLNNLSIFLYLNPDNSNSSSLYTFYTICLVEGKVLHFNKVQSRNPLDLDSFSHLKD